jgi:PhnB protein
MKLNTYLNFGGNCAEAFRFYEEHLGGKITMMMTHGQMPGPSSVNPDWKDKVLHVRIELGGTALYAADIPSPPFEPIRSAYLSLSVDSIDEAERIFGTAFGGWRGLHEDGRDFLCASLRDVSGQVRHVLDAA